MQSMQLCLVDHNGPLGPLGLVTRHGTLKTARSYYALHMFTSDKDITEGVP